MKLNDLNLGNVGNEITLRKTELEAKPSVLKKLDAVYDEHARLLFLFDTSGSMNSRVAADKHGKGYADQFIWSDVDALLAKVSSEIARLNLGDPLADETYAQLADKVPGPNNELMFTADVEELKNRIIRANMMDEFGVIPDLTKKHQQPPTRIELVKKLAKQEIATRFKKFPESKISVIPFSGHPVTLFDCQEPDNLWPALDLLSTSWNALLCRTCGKAYKYEGGNNRVACDCGGQLYMDGSDGGTDILSAIREAMELCRKKPSPVGIHHIIMVTDGEDYQADTNIGAWVPSMKASGVVLDYIHIGEESQANAGLKAACTALGGEYVTVNTEREIEAKFIAAVTRLLMPPDPKK